MTKDDLKAAFQILPETEADSEYWKDKCEQLREKIIDENWNPDDILSLPLIQSLMFVGDAPQYEAEIEFLNAANSNWRNKIGTELNGMPASNLRHQAYRLLRWQKSTGLAVKNFTKIIEIGGGYGAMAKVVRGFGFEGEYIIYDLAEFSLIQEYYLQQQNVRAVCRKGFPKTREYCGLMIACCSLNEMETESQLKFYEMIQANHILIESRDTLWHGKDNQKIFEMWFGGAMKEPAAYPPENYYLLS